MLFPPLSSGPKRQRSRSDKLAEAEAEALYRRCLALCGAALGEAHPETLVVATNLGVLLAEQVGTRRRRGGGKAYRWWGGGSREAAGHRDMDAGAYLRLAK